MHDKVVAVFVGITTNNFLRSVYREWRCGTSDVADMRISMAGFIRKGDVKDVSDSELQEWGQSLVAKTSQILSNTAPDIAFQVWGEGCVPRISGASVSEWYQSAQRIADSTLSGIVVFATVEEVSNTDFVVQPYFYIRLQNASDVEEIVGAYALGKPFHITALDPTTRRMAFNNFILPKITLLSRISVGLTYFSIQNYSQAERVFREALPLSDEAEEKVLFVLAGNAAGKDRRYEEALSLYQEALKIDPEYARALIGEGGVYYEFAYRAFVEQRAQGEINTQAIESFLEKAEEFFKHSVNAQHIPPFTAIPEKAYFGLGQIEMLRFVIFQETQHLSRAQTDFTFVIQHYENRHNEQTRLLAAESYARLGSIALLVQDCELALERYQRAKALTLEADRKELFSKRIAEIEQRLANKDRCIQPYSRGDTSNEP